MEANAYNLYRYSSEFKPPTQSHLHSPRRTALSPRASRDDISVPTVTTAAADDDFRFRPPPFFIPPNSGSGGRNALAAEWFFDSLQSLERQCNWINGNASVWLGLHPTPTHLPPPSGCCTTAEQQ
ncbi:pilus assembly protein CpaE [Anopheles sinensis]|uniref:Pilus assembly protein CpaE n=1 Tax=Anopheles sinensis TaxID=74873 RepID=A0A084VQT0_ANOSI|nr:pilus assembly protein CpaE [Anopheles sinensis]